MPAKGSVLRRVILAALAAAVSATSAVAADRRVVFINATRHTLVSLYVSSTADPRYPRDLLGFGRVRPGAMTLHDLTDGTGACWFDLIGVFSDGDYVVRRNVDICRQPALTFRGD